MIDLCKRRHQRYRHILFGATDDELGHTSSYQKSGCEGIRFFQPTQTATIPSIKLDTTWVMVLVDTLGRCIVEIDAPGGGGGGGGEGMLAGNSS